MPLSLVCAFLNSADNSSSDTWAQVTLLKQTHCWQEENREVSGWNAATGCHPGSPYLLFKWFRRKFAQIPRSTSISQNAGHKDFLTQGITVS